MAVSQFWRNIRGVAVILGVKDGVVQRNWNLLGRPPASWLIQRPDEVERLKSLLHEAERPTGKDSRRSKHQLQPIRIKTNKECRNFYRLRLSVESGCVAFPPREAEYIARQVLRTKRAPSVEALICALVAQGKACSAKHGWLALDPLDLPLSCAPHTLPPRWRKLGRLITDSGVIRLFTNALGRDTRALAHYSLRHFLYTLSPEQLLGVDRPDPAFERLLAGIAFFTRGRTPQRLPRRWRDVDVLRIHYAEARRQYKARRGKEKRLRDARVRAEHALARFHPRKRARVRRLLGVVREVGSSR